MAEVRPVASYDTPQVPVGCLPDASSLISLPNALPKIQPQPASHSRGSNPVGRAWRPCFGVVPRPKVVGISADQVASTTNHPQ